MKLEKYFGKEPFVWENIPRWVISHSRELREKAGKLGVSYGQLYYGIWNLIKDIDASDWLTLQQVDELASLIRESYEEIEQIAKLTNRRELEVLLETAKQFKHKICFWCLDSRPILTAKTAKLCYRFQEQPDKVTVCLSCCNDCLKQDKQTYLLCKRGQEEKNDL